MTIILTNQSIFYRGGEFFYRNDTELGPDYFTITCPDGYVSGPHCVSTASSLSVIELLHMNGHGHTPNNPCETCYGTGFHNTVKCKACDGSGKNKTTHKVTECGFCHHGRNTEDVTWLTGKIIAAKDDVCFYCNGTGLANKESV